MLLICETHPVPYHAPVYRHLAQELKLPLKVVYGSDYSVAGYFDKEFRSTLAWDSDLLDGYDFTFNTHSATSSTRDYESVTGRGIKEQIRGLTPKVVMALGYYHPLDRTAIRESLLQNLPLIFRGETNDSAMKRSLPWSLWRDWLLRRLYKRCAKLLYLGIQSKEHYLRLGAKDSQLIFSPYCVDERNFRYDENARSELRPSVRKELGLGDDDVVLLYSGKLCQRKGVDLLPKAIRLLPEALRQRCVLVFLGDGVLREQIASDCGSGPKVRTVFTGFKNQSQLSAYYHAADMLLLPSRQAETWGIVVNEALLHGIPCITSNLVGSHRDLIQPGVTGETFEAGDAGTLARAIETAHQSSLKLSAESQRTECRKVAMKYSVQTAAEGIATAYASIL